MVDQDLLKELRVIFDDGPDNATIDALPKALEYIKQIAEEEEEMITELEGVEFICQVIARDLDDKYWFSVKEGKVEYAKGVADNPTFTFDAPFLILAKIIFGEKDGPSSYMAGELSIDGNIADGLAFNDLLQTALAIFEDLTWEF